MKLALLPLLSLLLGGAMLETAELRELSLTEQHEAAQAAAEALAESPEFLAAPERARAEAWFTIGVAQHRAGAPEAALAAFLDARDLAGRGRTRLGAMYNLGTILLEQAEVVRATIPELAQSAGASGQPAPTSAPAPDEEAPDPLQVARAGYLGARQALVDRLRAEPEAGDTRANLELIVRRLRELDDLEQQREEQEQEQQNQSEEQEQQQQDESQDQEQSEDSEGEDSEDAQQDDEQEPQEGEQEEPSEEEQPPEEAEGDESEGEPEQQAAPEESEEELMTSEEIQRLMDRLREIEEQARAVQAMLRRREHVPVEKDW